MLFMMHEIQSSVVTQLNKIFPEAEFYMDDIGQDFTEPCFFILAVSSEQKQVIKDRYYRQYAFDIQYFPQDTGAPAEEISEVEAVLWTALEYVELQDGLVRGTQMRTQIIDGILHFFVQYDVFVLKKQEQIPVMEKFKQVQKIKK